MDLAQRFSRRYVTLIKENGSADIVDVEESGFEEYTYRPYAWSKRGKDLTGEEVAKVVCAPN